MAPLRSRVSTDWRDVARRAAQGAGLDPDIFTRQINQESGGRDVRSKAGAEGPAQFMPGTAQSVGLNDRTVHELEPSLTAAAKLMASYVQKYGSYKNALVAYNAGPGRVGKALPKETQEYVQTILGGRNPKGLSQPSETSSSSAQTLPGGSTGAGGSALPVASIQPQVAASAPQAPSFSATAKLALPQGYADPGSSWSPDGTLAQKIQAPVQAPDPNASDPIAEALTGKEQTRGLDPKSGASSALQWATSKVGFKETGTNSGGLASYLNQRFGMSSAPWCAMFTSAAVTKGGAPASARTASVAQIREKAARGVGYQRGYVKPEQAQPGDLILFGNAHVGMVQRVAGGRIHYVGGNQSNGVNEASAPVRGASIVRPKYGARK
jgi:hypothetical protein